MLDGIERQLPVRLLDRGHDEPRLPLSGSILVRLSRHRLPEPLTPRRLERWVEPCMIHPNDEKIWRTKEKSVRPTCMRAGARSATGEGKVEKKKRYFLEHRAAPDLMTQPGPSLIPLHQAEMSLSSRNANFREPALSSSFERGGVMSIMIFNDPLTHKSFGHTRADGSPREPQGIPLYFPLFFSKFSPRTEPTHGAPR